MNKQKIEKAIKCCEQYKGVAKTYGKQKGAKEDIKLLEVAISALEKQIPKKPIENFYNYDYPQLYKLIDIPYDEQNGDGWYDEGYTYQCPLCKESEVGRYSKERCEWVYQMAHCEKCGQAIDWRNNNEKVIYISTHEW